MLPSDKKRLQSSQTFGGVDGSGGGGGGLGGGCGGRVAVGAAVLDTRPESKGKCQNL